MDTNTQPSEYTRKKQFLAENPHFTLGWLNDVCNNAENNGMAEAGAILRLTQPGNSRGIVVIHRKKFYQVLENKNRRAA